MAAYQVAIYAGDNRYVIQPERFRSLAAAIEASPEFGCEILTAREAKSRINSGRHCSQTRRTYRYTAA